MQKECKKKTMISDKSDSIDTVILSASLKLIHVIFKKSLLLLETSTYHKVGQTTQNRYLK